jgi:hypothetical protein
MIVKIINLVIFEAAWTACILSAARGAPWIGMLVVLAWVGLQTALASPDRRGELKLLASALVLGYLLDSILVAIGVLGFPEPAQWGRPSTIWMAMMWVNFAATLNFSLNWLKTRYEWAVVLGALGGPAAYYGGMKLDAVTLAEPIGLALMTVGIQWALATPLLVWLSTRLATPAGKENLT